MQERILDNTYRLLEEIGRGGFGAVYRGVRIGAEGSGQVAIKLLNRNPALASDEYIRFQREATVMSQLVHPGIVTVYELSEDAGSYFIVMEFIAGANLREFVRQRGGKLPLADILGILIQVAEALEYVHSHEIAHRDIKPQNILVQEVRDRGEARIQVKLVDFGVARISGNGTPQVREGAVGTFAYMAPEATGLTEWPLDRRADIYSLGVVAFELLSGKTPFYDCRNEDILHAHVEKEPPTIASVRGGDISPVIENVVKKCITKNPADRYQSMFALVCDLKRMLSDLKSAGQIEDFEVARKDIGIGRSLEQAFVGRDAVVCEVTEFLEECQPRRHQVSWGMIRSGIGLGKTRVLAEIRRECELRKWKHLYVRFSETEQRLPFQSLSLAINDFLAIYHKQNRAAFKKLVGAIASELGPMVEELGRLIPALRQYAVQSSIEPHSNATSEAEDSGEADGGEVFAIDQVIDRRYVAPNQRVNDAFLALLERLVAGGDRLVFLMDDLHLADTSTISLFLYVIEQKSDELGFSFVFTMRDKPGRTNIILDSFVKRVSEADSLFRLWSLLPFDRSETGEFFRCLGMLKPEDRFIDFMLEKSNGSALQLNALVKDMLAQDILLPIQDGGTHRTKVWNLGVDWEKLDGFVVDHVNIEMLVASLESIDKRELALMKVAAVCGDACEFEYFRVDQEYSHVELETRLLNLVRKGILEIVGEDHAPIQRRAFVFTHEKIRTAVVARMDNDSRRQIHLALAGRIENLFKNPRKEQILSLANHYEGAGEKANPLSAVRAFLGAAKIYVVNHEYRTAEQLLKNAKESVKRIGAQRERIQRLREYYEVEYSLQEAQGNLVEASEVCRNLLDITYNAEKKEVLQIFYAQLLMGLGRHQHAYRQARIVLENSGAASGVGKSWSLLAFLNLFLMGSVWHRQFLGALRGLTSARHQQIRDSQRQAVLIMELTHLHGALPRHPFTFLLAARYSLYQSPIDRGNVIFSILHAALLLRRGEVQQAYKLYEDCEAFLQAQGLNSLRRWALALRSLWFDYPMGRMERLLTLVDNEAGAHLPTSGVMHFESYGMKAWVMLLSPSCRAAKAASGNENRRRRRSDKDGKGEGQFLENNAARRILDSGENSQYTALALFSNAIRFALGDKIEPLRRATEQLRRQQSVSAIGDAFALFAFSFQALVLGHQHESLKFYMRGMQTLVVAEVELLSLVVSDALRLASMFLPLMAISFQARGWPWGRQLSHALRAVDRTLAKAEGEKNPRRSPMTPLFCGFRAFLEGEQRESFILLEHAFKEARTQKCDLVECLALLVLGCFSGRMRLSRASEHFHSALKVARSHDLRLLERQVMGMAVLVGVDLSVDGVQPDEAASLTGISREKQTTLGLNEIVFKMQKLHASSTIDELLSETTRIVMSALHSDMGRAYLLENENGREKFVLKSIEGSNDDEDFNDRWILKLLPRSGEDPVRILPMDDADFQQMSVRESMNTVTSQITVGDTTVHETEEDITGASDATAALSATASDATAANFAGGESSDVTQAPRVGEGPKRASGEHRYLVLLAITSNRALLGWIAIPGVLSSTYSSRDVEHDLVLLGLHVGHILSRVYARQGIEVGETAASTAASQIASDRLLEIVDGELPREITIESLGKVATGSQTGWRIYRLKPRRVLVAQWKVISKSSTRSRHVGELIGRHLRFFAYSLRQGSEQGQLENMMIKLSSDITTILESAAKEGRFDALGINLLVVDCDEKRAIEGDFGGEAYSFSGVSEVEREYLQEIRGILNSDRLVYHERLRTVPGDGAWLFSPSERTEGLFAHFAQVDFLENYFKNCLKKGSHLPRALGIEKLNPVSALAIFMREKGDAEPE